MKKYNKINFTISPIQPEFTEKFRQAVGRVAREHKYLSFMDTPPLESSKQFVLDNIKQNMPHYVALVDDEIVGWCDISSLDRPVFKHAGSLGIGVVTGYRGCGLGSALLKKALEHAKRIGLTRIELTVREHNDVAINLYKKLGFEIEGVHRNAVLINGNYENHIFMALLTDE